MSGVVRACARIASSSLHVLHGIAIALVGFRALDAGQRHARIQWWARETLRRMGIALQVDGTPAGPGTLIVANHVSWLDIMAIHAVMPQARFVSKAAIKHWPLLSHLADAANTLYLERERKRDALRVVHLVAEALRDRETVAVFPEGTTSDGRDLLPFHANLLQSAIATGAPVQPIVLRFSDRTRPISPAVEFVGDTTLVQSLWRVARGDALTVHVSLLAPRASDGAERRDLGVQLREDIAARLRADSGR